MGYGNIAGSHKAPPIKINSLTLNGGLFPNRGRKLYPVFYSSITQLKPNKKPPLMLAQLIAGVLFILSVIGNRNFYL